MRSSPAKSDVRSTAYRTFTGVDHFASLDGLRFLSILAVLWHHSGITAGDAKILHRGQLGVHLFFAISGFLITSLMIRERRRHGQVSLPKFYMRRSLRIFPLYYAVLLVYIVVVALVEKGSADGKEFFRNLPAFATYTTNWFVELEAGERVIFYFAWSLAVEEQFYLTWPWVERYFRPWARMATLGVLISVVLANHLGLLLWAMSPEHLVYRILWYVAPCILFGVLSAHVLHSEGGFGLAWRIFGHRWSAPVVLALVVGALSVGRDDMVWMYVCYAALVGLVVASTIREDNGLAPFLRLKAFARVGRISYGIYLMHMLCFNAATRIGASIGIVNRWPIWIAGLILVYLTAELSFATFERFFQRRKARYSRQGAPASVVAPVGAPVGQTPMA